MTGTVVNLRAARKQRARAAKEAQAGANRTAFGRTKAQKDADAAARDRHERRLDGAKLED